ncbi:MAG: hypothetical protein ACUVQH_06305 [Thermogutta sp.]
MNVWSTPACCRFIVECDRLLSLYYGVRRLAAAFPFAVACYRFLFTIAYRRFTIDRIMGDSKLSPYCGVR